MKKNIYGIVKKRNYVFDFKTVGGHIVSPLSGFVLKLPPSEGLCRGLEALSHLEGVLLELVVVFCEGTWLISLVYYVCRAVRASVPSVNRIKY